MIDFSKCKTTKDYEQVLLLAVRLTFWQIQTAVYSRLLLFGNQILLEGLMHMNRQRFNSGFVR